MVVTVTAFLADLETWILALAASIWIYPALLAFSCIDGFFPPIPSESVIITLAVSAAVTGEPHLALVLFVAAVGAWLGDQISFALGRAVGTDRLRVLRGPQGRRAVAWAERTLGQRAASFILAARYIPIGRVAVNMTAGAVGFSRRRFAGLSAVAALTWSSYLVAIGLLAGQWLGHSPLLAMVVGIAAGAGTGLAVDRVLHTWATRRTEDVCRMVTTPTPLAPVS